MFLNYLGASGIFLVLLLAPFQWLILSATPELAMKPIHLAVAVCLAATLIDLRSLAHIVQRSRILQLIVLVYLLLLAWQLLALAWTSDIGVGAGKVAKDAYGFVAFLAIVDCVARLWRRGLFRSVAGSGAMLGLLVLVGYMILLFAVIGHNLLYEYYLAIRNADTARLHHWFYPRLFNCNFAGECLSRASDESAFGTALRNTLFGALVLQFVLIANWRSALRNRSLRLAAGGALGLALLLTLTSVSRSNILVLASTLLLFGVAYLIRHRAGLPSWLPALAASLVVLAIALAPLGSPVLEVTSDRFAFGEDPRIVQYRNALAAIGESGIWGLGVSAEVSTGNRTLRVHNFFLSSWLELGVVGFVLAVIWYALVGYAFGRRFLAASSKANRWHSIWPALLPVLPLVRMLVSGEGGHLTLVEWVALGVFFGVLGEDAEGGAPSGLPVSR